MKRLSIWYHGRVQGVGFRATCTMVARNFNVVGRVSNLADGSVEMFAEGDKPELERFRDSIAIELQRNIHSTVERWSEADGQWTDFRPGPDGSHSSPRAGQSLVVLTVVLALAAALAAGVWYFRDQLFPAGTELVLPGVVEQQEVRLSSKIGGRINEVRAVEGAQAAAGDILVLIDAPEMEARLAQLNAQLRIAEARLKQAQNGPLPEQLDAARSALNMARARLARLKSGSRPEEISEAKSEVEMRQAEEQRARQDLDRMLTLFVSNSISRSELDGSQAYWKQTRSLFEMASQRLRLLELGPRIESIEESTAEVQKWEADLRLLERGTRQEELDQLYAQTEEVRARIQEAQANLAESKIVAPSACLVEVVTVRPGDMVAPSQPVIRVRRPDDLWVKAYVPETELSRVSLDMEVAVTHDNSSKEYRGVIFHIASGGEFTPRNVQSASERQNQVFAIKVRVEDPEQQFKSGMAAQVTVPKKTGQ